MSLKFQQKCLIIPAECAGARLDSALARLLPEHSRSRIKQWIEAGAVQLRRSACRPSDRVDAGDEVSVQSPLDTREEPVAAESIPFEIVHEDRDCLVIDKPAGMVVHPGAGNSQHTLQNALLGLDPHLASLPRAGLIHRLDKDTSGLLVVARTPEAQTSLSRQLLRRTVTREYEAVCVGVMTGGGRIDKPIARNRRDRLRMAIREDGRAAVTHYRLLERFRAHTHVRVQLETGRTHQIRVHLSHSGYALVGDAVYGGRLMVPRAASESLIDTLRSFKRQALHAAMLCFDHPRSAERKRFESPLPPDMVKLLRALRADAREHS